MQEEYGEYEVEIAANKSVVWVHSRADGSTVGRFGKMGVDIHNTVTDQLNGAPECRLCTHGLVTESDWALFRDKALEFWGVTIPIDAFNKLNFKEYWQ